jgi:outer membrane receptor protein involved in Fe transport
LNAPSTTVSASDSDQTDNLHDYSFFGQDTVHLGDKWIVVAGGRFLHYRQVAGKGRPFVANTNIEGDKFLPAPAWSTRRPALPRPISATASRSNPLRPSLRSPAALSSIPAFNRNAVGSSKVA